MKTTLFTLLLLAVILLGQQTPPSGTAATENFGGTTINPQTCPDGSTVGCTQLYTTSGTAPVITSSTGCSGWSGNTVKLGSTSVIYTNGTWPTIPAGTNYTITFTECASSIPSAFTLMFETFTSDGGSSDSFLNFHSTTGIEFPNSTTCAAAAGAMHTIVLNINGASSIGEIDGAQCGSAWTDAGKPIGRIQWAGNSTGSLYIQSWSITGPSSITGGWPPSAFFNWNGQSGNTVNAANLQLGTVCGNAYSGTSVGDWVETSPTGITYTFITAGQAFPANLPVCGTSYAGTSNVALHMAVATTANATGGWSDTFNTVYNTAAVGFYVKLTATGTLGAAGNIDFTDMHGPGSASYGLQFYDAGSTNVDICFENYLGGGSAPCTSSPISSGTWYWVSYILNPTAVGSNYAWIYSVSGSGGVTLIQKLTAVGTFEAMTPGSIQLYLAKTGNETITNAATVDYSNVIVQYANASGPVLPPSNAALRLPVIVR